MNRRNFLAGLLAAPIAHEVEPVRRVYSFLWSNPVGVDRVVFETGLVSWPRPRPPEQPAVELVDPHDVVNFEVGAMLDFDAMLRGWYSPEVVRSLTIGPESRMAGLLAKGSATVVSVDRERGEFTFGKPFTG